MRKNQEGHGLKVLEGRAPLEEAGSWGSVGEALTARSRISIAGRKHMEGAGKSCGCEGDQGTGDPPRAADLLGGELRGGGRKKTPSCVLASRRAPSAVTLLKFSAIEQGSPRLPFALAPQSV